MREIFEYYLKNCQHAMIHKDELLFDFGDCSIIYCFQREDDSEDGNEDYYDEDFFSFNTIDSINVIDDLLRMNLLFLSAKIEGYEYLGNRDAYLEEASSITNLMHFFYKKLKKFDEKCLVDKSVFIHFDDDWGMCAGEPNYCFEIVISDDFLWDGELAKYILSFLNSTVIDVSANDFYTPFFRKKGKLNDSRIVSILSTNTKVRRLGYFKILSNFLDDHKKIPVVSINKKFEDYCLEYKNLLEENLFKKGLIDKTKTGISAKPYIDISTDLSFLNKINNIYHPGKSFKVYQILQSQYNDSNNIFKLSDFDKIFFLEHILRNDYFYFSVLLELIFIEEKTTYSSLRSSYQEQLINRLVYYKNSNPFGDRKVLNNIDTISNRIKKWEKPDKYLEHIIMPRLNWMLDLSIITGTNDEYLITETGLKLFKHISIWNDINTDKIISPNAFLDRFIIHVYDDCYNKDEKQTPSDINFILERLYNYIEESFELFKTIAPNRVTASQAANYAKYKLYFNDDIKVGYQFILNNLSEKEQNKFIFKYQEQYQDGYIQKKN